MKDGGVQWRLRFLSLGCLSALQTMTGMLQPWLLDHELG